MNRTERKIMGKARNWTPEEKQYLRENWGTKSIGTLMKNLNRSRNSINVMKARLKLGAFLDNGDYVTWNQLMKALGKGTSVSYHNKNWIEDRDFPIHWKRVGDYSFRVVYVEEFWKWAEKNVNLLDFSNFEENALGMEPAWVKGKRRRDFERTRAFLTSPWTSAEDTKLRRMLEKQRYSCRDLSLELRRTEGAIVRRISELGIKERPVKADNHVKWTDEEFARLGELIKAGYCYEEISARIGKSVKALRGRVYAMYLTENLDRARTLIGTGFWGDNRPERKIRQYSAMDPEEKAEAKDLLERLAAVLRQEFENQADQTEFGRFFQKDMCRNYCGDCLGTAGCDECLNFERIRPQACKMCGKTFYERKDNLYCSTCRTMRKKQYLRKKMALGG